MNPTIMRLALKALLGGWRGLVLFGLPILLVVLATALRLLTGTEVSPSLLIVETGLALVVPLVALLAANGVLGPEIDDGSVVYLLATPVRRSVVAISKYVVAASVAVVASVGGLLVSSLIGGVGSEWVLTGVITGGVAALLYSALFTAMSAATRYGMIIGLIYVLVIEGVLGRYLSGFRYLSVSSIAERIGEAVAEIDLPVEDMSLAFALVASVVLLVGGVAAAGWRLQRFQLSGDE